MMEEKEKKRMMSLTGRLTLQVIGIVLLSSLIIAFIFTLAFSTSFNHFLIDNEDQKINRIIDDINIFIQHEGIEMTRSEKDFQLNSFVQGADINVTIMDNDSRILATYNGLKSPSGANLRIEEKYLLPPPGKNGEQVLPAQYVGKMWLTHDPQSPNNREFMKEFLLSALGPLFFTAILFILLAIYMAYRLSKSITGPIESLSNYVARLRQGDYHAKSPASSISEFSSLSNNLEVLSNTLSRQEETRLEYAQDISHELRTPLTNLSLHIEAMEDGVIAPDEKALSVLKSNVNQLTSIINRLRKTFQEASYTASVDFQLLDLSAKTNRLLDAIEPMVEKKHASIERNIEPDLTLTTDERLYSQIFNNLLSNANKAIAERGIIKIFLFQQKNQIILKVEDNGVGIKKEALPHIFDRFYRVDSSRNRALGGQGLGLSITKNYVNLLGGEIFVSSEEGLGSIFTVSFEKKSPSLTDTIG